MSEVILHHCFRLEEAATSSARFPQPPRILVLRTRIGRARHFDRSSPSYPHALPGLAGHGASSSPKERSVQCGHCCAAAQRRAAGFYTFSRNPRNSKPETRNLKPETLNPKLHPLPSYRIQSLHDDICQTCETALSPPPSPREVSVNRSLHSELGSFTSSKLTCQPEPRINCRLWAPTPRQLTGVPH